VVERSDVVVQIVDARNPLLFRCPDLDQYVKEVDPRKRCVLMINKADYLSRHARQQWVKYLKSQGKLAHRQIISQLHHTIQQRRSISSLVSSCI
jgi:ribosome biogenesis GTPase A